MDDVGKLGRPPQRVAVDLPVESFGLASGFAGVDRLRQGNGNAERQLP